MCTVVTEWTPGEPVRILAIRDEFVSREFDLPGRWWAEQPGAVGGRDRLAGGSWCVSDPATGVSALVLNRTERRTGTPSRGVLPLAALRFGTGWSEQLRHDAMAAFTLVLAGPGGVVAWTWDATELVRHDLVPGVHLFTTAGVDGEGGKAGALAREFAARPWLDVVTARAPRDDRDALIVRHTVDAASDGEVDGLPDGAVYATVFGQLITAERGAVTIASSRTPWLVGTWTEQRWLPAG